MSSEPEDRYDPRRSSRQWEDRFFEESSRIIKDASSSDLQSRRSRDEDKTPVAAGGEESWFKSASSAGSVEGNASVDKTRGGRDPDLPSDIFQSERAPSRPDRCLPIGFQSTEENQREYSIWSNNESDESDPIRFGRVEGVSWLHEGARPFPGSGPRSGFGPGTFYHPTRNPLSERDYLHSSINSAQGFRRGSSGDSSRPGKDQVDYSYQHQVTSSERLQPNEGGHHQLRYERPALHRADGIDWNTQSLDKYNDTIDAVTSDIRFAPTSLDASPTVQGGFRSMPTSFTPRRANDRSSARAPAFTDLALNVSYSGLDPSSPSLLQCRSRKPTPSKDSEEIPEFWEDLGVVEWLDTRLVAPDESTPDERVEFLKEILQENDILEGHGVVPDFLYHVARTKHGKIYIRVIRTFLLNKVLCSNRVSQMTKTYNDIEAVTRLLEEKEKDLELTARIGKELLSHNQKLENTVSSLESELKEANERITQLSHELAKKTELIQVLTNDADDSSSEAGTPIGLRGINLDMMQRKISTLEEENKQLRTEFTKLVHEADDSEEQEARLVKDIAAQLASANMEVDGIALELERQREENRLQHEQIVSLSAKLAETELRLAQLVAEHDEVGATLLITRDNQHNLANELAEFKDRYAEVVNLLAETQEQLRRQRKRGMPTVRGGSLFPSLGMAPQPDSIASELESSLYSELSMDSGISSDRIPTYKKVFETVRSASRNYSTATSDPNQFPRIGSMTTSTLSSSSSGPRMSCGQIRPVGSTYPGSDSAGQSDSEGGLITDCEDYPGAPQPGVPGAPGAADLEAALRRLTPAEVLARRACLSTGTGYTFDYDAGPRSPSTFVPHGCRTPDSIMSTGSSGNLSGYSSGNAWRLPEKLQIVKPMEGSQTLHHWSQLATPTLGGLLEERPGVKTRGGRGLEDLGLVTFTLSDLEEDEEFANPGKLFQDTGSVYTFTNSTVLHPDDHTSVTGSIIGSRVATAPSSELNSGMSTPRTLSRRNSTSTFSTTLGLAKMLNERGIKAITPSSVGTPNTDKNFSPTATPCNSPDRSPAESRSTSPPPESALPFGLFYSGAELLKRTFGVEQPSKRPRKNLPRQERKAVTGIRLVEKLERIGIDSIMATTVGSTISPLALQGSLYTRRATESPMAQLTFLKSSMSSSGSQETLSSSLTASSDTQSTTLRSDGKKKKDVTVGRQRRGGTKATRPDLGQVIPAVPVTTSKESPAQTALGTISSLLFGRKGGLL